jgi:hypothetical protein
MIALLKEFKEVIIHFLNYINSSQIRFLVYIYLVWSIPYIINWLFTHNAELQQRGQMAERK